MDRNEANWWRFSLAPAERGERISDDPAAGTTEVNRPQGGKHLLSYASYLQLDQLLGSQRPGSLAPEERVFITSHQLCELLFKQIIFDLRVIADTLADLLSHPRPTLITLAGAEPGREDFWTPALTAAARVHHGCKRLLPAIFAYLAREETFNNREFTDHFRQHLTPASGFQSAQFRLIQRAFGKSNLLTIRLFPADGYLRDYQGLDPAAIDRHRLTSADAGLLRVIDPLILREESAIATPPPSSPLFAVAGLDDLAHRVLLEIGLTTDQRAGEGEEEAIPLLAAEPAALAGMAEGFRRELTTALAMITGRPADQAATMMLDQRTEVFRADWTTAVTEENRRRRTFTGAGRGGRLLLAAPRPGPLATVLRHLLAADAALDQSFLLPHRQMVAHRLGPVPGTAGGGLPFLDLARTLAAGFPALVALPRPAA